MAVGHEEEEILHSFIYVLAANPAWQRWYEKNKEHFLDLVKQHKRNRREELKDLINEKKSAPCKKCGKKYHPAAIDLVHRDGEDKRFRISDASKLIY
jgi:hypothetical protein